jgi:molybdate transport system substrate-binding protein
MMLTLFAAGSLKSAFLPLLDRFRQDSGIDVVVQFGPAGLLRERIEAGEPCSLFASANTQHPQALLAAGCALEVHSFAANQLNLTARVMPATDSADWLSLLRDPALTLGTSTPGCDPSGDYTWQLFDNIDAQYPGTGAAIKQRAKMLVGGRQTLTVPEGEIASAWLIRQRLADLFIGYAHYSQALVGHTDIRTLAIPLPYNVRCEYQMALLDAQPAVRQLMHFILSAQGQHFLREAGFLTLDGK